MEERYRDNKTVSAIMAQIKKGRVSMRPRWQFVLKGIFAIVGAVIVCLALLYFSSFLVYALSFTGAIFAPGFGLMGLAVFLRSLPWLLIALSVLFLAILEVLVRKYSFAYRKPLLYSLVAILCIVALTSLVEEKLEVHERLYTFSRDHQVPLVGSLYGSFARFENGEVHIGTIASTTDNGFIIISRRGKQAMVIISSGTRMPYGSELEEGGRVVVLGSDDDGVIQASGVREFPATQTGVK